MTRGRRARNNGGGVAGTGMSRSNSDAALNGLAVTEPINRAINDPMHIAVDLGINSDYEDSGRIRESPPRNIHRDDQPIS